jgi:predicted transposase YbfD/YdcC
VFARLDSEEFETSFLSWVQAVMRQTQGDVVAIDGKQLRRSHDQALGKSPIWMVSAWAAGNRLVLGQVKVAEKSNEITAIPRLLEVLDLRGCLVTMDAMGTQTEIAKAIVEREADYLLALKQNQGNLYQQVAATFAEAEAAAFEHVPCDTCRTVNKGHTCQMHHTPVYPDGGRCAGGRLEIRECWLINRADYLNALGDRARWTNLNGIAMVRAERRVGEAEAETTTRYYLTSLKDNAPRVLEAVRSHWAVENDLHGSLDVTFHEDLCRVRKQAGPENFAVLRHIALNLLKQEKSVRIGLKGKRLKAGWDDAYLLKVLAI